MASEYYSTQFSEYAAVLSQRTNDIVHALAEKHEYAMTRDQALHAFDMVLRSFESGQIFIATGDLEQRIVAPFSAPASQETRLQINNRNPRPMLKTVYMPAQNKIEQKLIEIWQDILGVDGIGINDDFFELGGHSLLATRLVATVGSALDVDLPLAMLFEGPTVRTMAEAVIQAHHNNRVGLVM
jgi:acyl carrier protein